MITVLLFALLVCILFKKYFIFYKEFSRLKKISRNIPGPKPLPFFGNALSIGSNPHDAFQYLKNVTKQYGPTTALWIGSELRVYISDKEDMKMILNSNVHLKKSNIYEFMHDWIGRGLVTADGERWRRNRKILTPTFHFKMLENYIDIFNSNYKVLTNLMKTELGNEGFNVIEYIGNCVTDNLYESALKIQGNAQLDRNNKFAQSQMWIKVGVGERINKYWLHPKILFALSNCGRNYKRGLEYLHCLVNQVISGKKRILDEKYNEEKKEENNVEEKSGKKKQVFIDLLLQIAMDPKSYLTDDELLFEVATFVAAGHGTLSTTLGFVLHELAYNQNIQDKVFQEIHNHFGKDKRQPTFQELQEFPYLEMVIKETLRLYPPPYLGREIKEDVLLPSGYTIPAGSSVLFDWIHLHKDPTEYANPEIFNPDHFLPEACAHRHPFAFVPFSAGPRNCIGQKYAMLDLKAGLIQMLRIYKFLPSEKLPKMKIGYAIVLYSTTGVNLRIEERNAH